jgi:membrane-bound ClpP family serine protease
MEPPSELEKASRTKRAELLSSVGAGVLGGGLVLLFAEALKPYATAILLVGLGTHAWGMFQKHQIERRGQNVAVWWAEVLYWFCWLVLLRCFCSFWAAGCKRMACR